MSLRRSTAKRLRAWITPEPVPGDEVDHLLIDLRALWALGGAWWAALALVRVDRTGQLVVSLLALSGCTIIALRLHRVRRTRFVRRGWGTALGSSVGLALAGAALVGCSLVITQPVPRDHLLSAASDAKQVIRVQLRLLESPRPFRLGQGFGEERGTVPGLLSAARVQAVMVDGSWEPADVRVNLSWATGTGPAMPGSVAPAAAAAPEAGTAASPQTGVPADVAAMESGDVLRVLVGISAAEPGERARWWLRATVPPERIGHAPGNRITGAAASLRAGFRQGTMVLPQPGRALLPGMVMGDRSGQDEELTAAMKVAGLAHLTAVSGANCVMICGAVVWLARLAHANRLVSWLIGLGALAGFVVLVGPEPSVLRAAVMGAIAAASLQAGRGAHALPALALAMSLLLVHDPWLAGDHAFQLSGLATAGIVLMGKPLSVRLRTRLPVWLADSVAIATAAQLACLPVVLLFGGGFPLYAVAANLLVAPLIPWITVVGTAALLLGAASPVAGGVLIWFSGPVAGLVGLLGTWIATWPGASRPWPAGIGGSIISWGSCALMLLALLGPRGTGGPGALLVRIAPVLALGLLAGALFPASSLLPLRTGAWVVAACDVGQGDALVINTGNGSGILVDAGPEPAAIDACLRGLGINRFDALFITHLHADHQAGLPGALKGRETGAIYYSTSKTGKTPPGHPEARLLSAGASGHGATVDWEVVGPVGGGAPVDENEASLVIRFRIKGSGQGQRPLTFLATGDLEEEAMARVLDSGGIGPADILKVSHHGASNGGVAVIDAAAPALALISVGAGNSYGHPHPRITGALAERGIPGYRTDESGTILISRRGTGLWVTGWKGREQGAGG